MGIAASRAAREKVLVNNGRSARTFIEEGRWSDLVKKVQKGDYVVMQFGHNDSSKNKVGRYTFPPKTIKKTCPVLLTKQEPKAGDPSSVCSGSMSSF